ncbi:MAG TPA: hypothetical protein PLT75_16555 [Spirochaetota bacterium]|nr:hypothetical protein [Spirochaetota bacterium]
MKLFSRRHAAGIIFFFIVIFAGACSSAECTETGNDCNTRYPILLVHGLGFRDTTMFLKYWGPVPGALKQRGASVFQSTQDAYSPLRVNAMQLKKSINDIIDTTGCGKVNIIAHSRGGIESRYLISRLGMEHKIASLTTIATPHRGSTTARVILNKVGDSKIMAKMVDLYAKMIGDTNPSSVSAGRGLTPEFMRSFNRNTPDAEGVYYQSYGCVIDSTYPNPVWRAMAALLAKHEGPNDGLVSAESCKWGNFRGILKCGNDAHVSHADIIGLHLLTGVRCFDAPSFYITIVRELKEKGF